MDIKNAKLLERYQTVRKRSMGICQPLEVEDHMIQSMPDVSPPKWHLAHTTWFFETFILKNMIQDYEPFHPQFNYLFNSYYKGIGSHHLREKRGLLSRPTLNEIHEYRKIVDEKIQTSFFDEKKIIPYLFLIELGIHHEEQHQELLLMDILHIFYSNPLRPIYRFSSFEKFIPSHVSPINWISFNQTSQSIGAENNGFAFDNERPKHQVFIKPFQLAHRLISNLEYLEFMQSGAYNQPRWWLSDGWDWIEKTKTDSPLYWEKNHQEWWQMTLHGMEKLDLHAPVSHVSYYEADAYARWCGKRLATEAEWEVAAAQQEIQGNFFESDLLKPKFPNENVTSQPVQLYGDVWEWTQSPYVAYPGFTSSEGAIGEYNGKFMCNQIALRGGSCWTPMAHIRPTYRNFFPPHSRWLCGGIRLAEDQ